MSQKVGDKVEYEGNKAVVTSVHSNGCDVAVATEQTGGRCRAMYLGIDEAELDSREE